MRTSLRAGLALLVLLVGVNAASATPFTMATFSDPAANGNSPLFTMHYIEDDITGDYMVDSITGAWPGSSTPVGDGLVLSVPFDNQVYKHVTFTMAPVAVNADTGRMSAGVIQFFDEHSAPLMSVSWTAGRASIYSFGAADTPARQTLVTINYKSYTFTDESFGIGFANPVYTPDGAGAGYMTVTGSFTSSVVPEPTSLIVLGLGMVAMLRRRRH